MSGGPRVIVACSIGSYDFKCMDSILRISHTPIMYLFDKTGRISSFQPGTPYNSSTAGYFERLKFITESRNNILKRAMKIGFDYIFCVDADMEVYPRVVDDLLAHTNDFEVVTGSYKCRGWTCDSAHTWLGMGCVLISCRVLKLVGLFEWQRGKLVGEDIIFASKLKKLGISVKYADEVKVNHHDTIVEKNYNTGRYVCND